MLDILQKHDGNVLYIGDEVNEGNDRCIRRMQHDRITTFNTSSPAMTYVLLKLLSEKEV